MNQRPFSIYFGIILSICAVDSIAGTDSVPTANAVTSAFIAKLDAEDRIAYQNYKATIPEQENRIVELQKQYTQCMADRCMQLSGSGGVWVDREEYEKWPRNSTGFVSHDDCLRVVKPQCEFKLQDAKIVQREIDQARNSEFHLRSANWVFYIQDVKNYEGTIIAMIGTRRKGSDHSYDWKVTMHANGSSLMVDGYACNFEHNAASAHICYNGGSLN